MFIQNVEKKLKEIKHRKDAIIQYGIEGVEKHEDKLVIRGWAVDHIDKEPVAFSVFGDYEDSVQLKRRLNPIINQTYNLNPKMLSGFQLVFKGDWINRKQLRLQLSNQRGDVRNIRLDLNGDKHVSLTNRLRYPIWIKRNEPEILTMTMFDKMESWSYKPLISIVMPVYNVPLNYLRACVDSVKDQWYGNWELCLVDDHSTNPEIKPFLEALCEEDERIQCHFRTENGHISRATNDAIASATGEFIALLDNDDTLAPFALYRMVEMLNKDPKLDFIYSDEDKIDELDVRKDPFFKPDWSPDTLLSHNYICHFTMIRKTIVDKVGGLEPGLEGAQDHDLFLKCTEKTDRIGHIPHILYHWRESDASTAKNSESKPYAFVAGRTTMENALKRRNISGNVKEGVVPHTYIMDYEPIGDPMVSIIIPTRDHSDDLTKCVNAVIHKAGYNNWEIIVIDNGSKEPETKQCFDAFSKKLNEKFRILTMDVPFNYALLNNAAAKAAKGEYLLLLNNDVELLTDNWMPKLLGYACQDHIGAVGCKLYYPDDTIQHAGVVLGIGDVVGYSHKYQSRYSVGSFACLQVPSNYAAVTGACLMIQKSKYLEAGGLDEKNLAVVFNDVDFCLKLLEKGYFNVCIPQVEAYHDESKTRGLALTKKEQRRYRKEVDYMQQRWKSLLINDPYYSVHLTRKRENFSVRRNGMSRREIFQ